MKNARVGSRSLAMLGAVLGLALGAGSLQATVVTWTNTAGSWDLAGNWNPAQVPTSGDEVVITNAGASVLLAGASSNLATLVLGGTLTFTNWSTKLSATGDVTILAGGVITLPAAFSNGVMSNRVWIACSNLIVEQGGQINADGKGWAGANGYEGDSLAPNGSGPGGGRGFLGIGSLGYQNYSSGAGHGGRGGWGSPLSYKEGSFEVMIGGGIYGSPQAPADPGSGGGASLRDFNGNSPGDYGGNGGGAVRIQAGGGVTLNGTITANGGNAKPYQASASYYGGGGAGGSIWIDCLAFTGTNGVIQANGGDPTYFGGGGAGGGGRIAINYNTGAQALLAKPSVRFLANPGYGCAEYLYGYGVPQGADIGTLAFPDNSLLDPAAVRHVGQWLVPGMTNLSFSSLVVTDAWVRFPVDGFSLVVTNDLVVSGGALKPATMLELGRTLTNGSPAITNLNQWLRYDVSCFTTGPAVNCGNLILTNGGALHLGFGSGNLSGQDCGALVKAAGTISIGSNSWLYPYSHPTSGVSALLQMQALNINAGGGVDASGRGFAGGGGIGMQDNGYGPGGGPGGWNWLPGGGHGGKGGNWSGWVGGPTYGDSNAPALPGSGSGGSPGSWANDPVGDWGGPGGGMIWIKASDSVTVNGTLTAAGVDGKPFTGNPYNLGNYGGGGAGGAIRIACMRLAGAGAIKADGAISARNGGGGGGRIAVRRLPAGDTYTGSYSVQGSLNGPGANGTITWTDVILPPGGTIIKFR